MCKSERISRQISAEELVHFVHWSIRDPNYCTLSVVHCSYEVVCCQIEVVVCYDRFVLVNYIFITNLSSRVGIIIVNN